LKHNGGRNGKRGLQNMWKTKCRIFYGVVAPEVEQRKWGWHPFFDIFLHTHNNNEATIVCDKVCNMKKVSMFYPISWCARFLKLYTFLKKINIPLVHPLCGTTKRNYKQWIFKGSTIGNHKQS
jgi:hypothetical protein